MKRITLFVMMLGLVFVFGCGKQNPVAVNDEMEMSIEDEINGLKLEKHETYPIKFQIDYTNRIVIDEGTYRWNPNTRIEHIYQMYWTGGVITGDIVGQDTLTKYGHWAHILEDGSSDRFWRHANCRFVVTWGEYEFPFHVFWALKEGRDYAYGKNFGALYKDAENKVIWAIEAELKSDTWNGYYFTCEGTLRKFYPERLREEF